MATPSCTVVMKPQVSGQSCGQAPRTCVDDSLESAPEPDVAGHAAAPEPAPVMIREAKKMAASRLAEEAQRQAPVAALSDQADVHEQAAEALKAEAPALAAKPRPAPAKAKEETLVAQLEELLALRGKGDTQAADALLARLRQDYPQLDIEAELERLGTLAAERDRRQTRRAIVPFGGADVVTLLGSASLRRELVATEGGGMVALIVPLRARGWRATYASDPAYGPALASAMPDLERGFDRPLLVTAEEICEVRAGGDPMRLLREEPD